MLRQAIATHGATAPLTVLHRVIERVRAREAGVAADEADAWRVVRAATHLALAMRGSRLAVYDLRESVEALGSQTPVGMLSALQQVGDASVLDAVADAWAGSTERVVPRPVGHDLPRDRGAREDHEAARRREEIAARLPEAFAALWE